MMAAITAIQIEHTIAMLIAIATFAGVKYFLIGVIIG